MQSKRIQKLLRKKKSDSGFTLLELLTGLTMSGIVVGALGFGLYQVLKTTSNDASETKAREQSSRVIEFITDEIRRARTIDNDLLDDLDNDGTEDDNTAPNFTATDKTVVLALDIPEITDHIDVDGDSDYIGSDDNTGTSERIVYYLKSTGLGNWKGPQVLYRWGPPLDANGDYTEGNWQEEALIDGVDDTAITTSPCDGGATLNPPINTAAGFYACLNGPSGGDFNTAQIFLTGEISNVAGENTNFTSDTQAVARAKDADVVAMVDVPTEPLTFESLGAEFSCNPNATWGMRTDFGQFEDSATGTERNPSNTRKWVHNPDRKNQPINIDSTKPLYITAIPLDTKNLIDAASCLNSKFSTTENHNLKGKDIWHDVDGDGNNDKNIVFTQHKIDFNNPYTFNGDFNDDMTNNNENTGDVRTEDTNGDGVIDSNDDINTKVKILKKGTEVPNYGGYDANNDGDNDDPGDQPSLGEFLASKGYADLVNGDYVINGKLQNNQRIIAFEIGQDNEYLADGTTPHPGFDLQDNMFVVTSDAFTNKF